tara:strand:- start:312 stop:1514 length:1203 start_codon:yes stop_codon:yes gene_type:complete
MGKIIQTDLFNTSKDELQHEHLNKWVSNGYKGTSIAATGLGKTRIGILAIANTLGKDPKKSALVIVPTENLRDNEWINEFNQWNEEHLLPQIEFMCIQSAYKLEGHHWDIVIVDEVHTTLSKEYRNFYENNLWERMYCFTATPPENKEYLTYLEQWAPIIKTTDLNEAKSLGLVSQYTVYNLGLSFTPEEALEYNRVDKIFKEATDELGGQFAAFSNAGKLLRTGHGEKRKTAIIFYKMMNKRKQLCFNAFNKLMAVHKLTKKFSDRKTLVFSESIEFAEDIKTIVGDTCSVFHSKMKKKDRTAVLESFSEVDGTRVLSSVKALNAGLNVPECSLGICVAGSSKALDNIQRTGRTLRFIDGKKAIYINMYIKGSQELKWVRKRTKDDYSTKWIESIDEIV